MNVNRSLVLSLALLAVLNVLDWAMTWLWLQSGLGYERNPVMRWAYEQGPWFALALKAMGYAACAGVLVAVSRVSSRLAIMAARAANLAYFMIAGWHLAGVFTAIPWAWR
jgi:hypothetical protein